MGRLCVLTRIQQPMEMNDEKAHVRIVHGLLRLCLPGRVGGRVIGVDPDDLDLIEILESVVLEIGQLAADDEMEQLLRLGTIWHVYYSW
jgi:hypothetical protein